MRSWSIALLALIGLAAGSARAGDYPARPVKLIIPFAAGAGTDLSGRIVADELGKRLGQQFIVENKPGAAAQLGTDFVAKAEPDGYTLLWTVSDGLSVLPAVKLSLPYKVPDDFAFIGSIAPHLTIAMIAAEAGIQMVHVPFPGLGPATNALVAGQVDAGLVTPVQGKQLIDAGSIRAL